MSPNRPLLSTVVPVVFTMPMMALRAVFAFAFIAVIWSGQAFGADERFYVISNKADRNTVVGFRSDANGKFSLFGEFATGGKGTGDLEVPALKKDDTHPLANGDDPLISANALVRTKDGKFLIAVNPGDATVSLMAVADNGNLVSRSTVASPSRFPVSLAVYGDLVAVAAIGNTNGEGSIGLYKIDGSSLTVVKDSKRELNARPSTINFSSDGAHVIVNELVTGKVKIFSAKDGILSSKEVSFANSPRDNESRFQAIPVGFVVHGNKIFMSEARFLTPDFKLREDKGVVAQSPLYSWQTSSVSSYVLSPDGEISLLSGDILSGASVEGGEIASCWVALSADGKTLYTANALSSSISTYRVRENGTLAILNVHAFKDKSEKLFFGDMTLSRDGKQLYQLIGNTGEVMIFDVMPDANLKVAQKVGGMPKLGTFGMVAF